MLIPGLCIGAALRQPCLMTVMITHYLKEQKKNKGDARGIIRTGRLWRFWCCKSSWWCPRWWSLRFAQLPHPSHKIECSNIGPLVLVLLLLWWWCLTVLYPSLQLSIWYGLNYRLHILDGCQCSCLNLRRANSIPQKTSVLTFLLSLTKFCM